MQRRQIKLESFDDVIAELERLHQNGYDIAGNWSLGQVCNHLAAAIDMMVEGKMRLIPRFIKRAFLSSFLLAVPLGRFGNALGLRIPTNLPQNKSVHDEEGIARLRICIDKLRPSEQSYLHAFHLFHCNHHLSFLIPNESS